MRFAPSASVIAQKLALKSQNWYRVSYMAYMTGGWAAPTNPIREDYFRWEKLSLHELPPYKSKIKFFAIFTIRWQSLIETRTGASPGTFSTVSGTAQIFPAEDLKVQFSKYMCRFLLTAVWHDLSGFEFFVWILLWIFLPQLYFL